MPTFLKVWILIRWLIARTLSLIRRHPRFSECFLLGFLGAFLLSVIPWVGHILAAIAIALAIFSGVVSETRTPNKLSYRK